MSATGFTRPGVLLMAAALLVALVPALSQAQQPRAVSDPAVPQVEAAAQAWLDRYIADHAFTDATGSVAVQPARRAAPACDAPYDIAAVETKSLTRLRFSARCPGQTRATAYVVRTRLEVPVLIAASALPANQPISEADVAREVRDIAPMPDALTDAAALANRRTRRALKAGQVLQARLLKGAEAVRRGQAVQIVANTGPVEVTAAGTAMQDGAIDDVIHVKNTATGKTITARVTGTGTVEPVGSVKK